MNRQKVLIVIPAYNEANNIGAVLADIKQYAPDFDVVVIDDHSTDSTKEVVQASGVNCITNIFNLRYAWAIQTGLKYAKSQNYNYAILMDADGQHLASEAKKLYQTALKTKSNIVIGSRYLKNLGYHCPFFRKIGTKFFASLVRLFTKQKITDPLSGFQCIDQKTIDYYSSCGNYPEYPDANLVIEMLLQGYTITETPVKMKLRESGASMHSGLWKPIKYMITQFFICIVIFVEYVGKRKAKHE